MASTAKKNVGKTQQQQQQSVTRKPTGVDRARAQQQQPQPQHGNPDLSRGVRKLGDVDLSMEWMTREELAAAGPFNITDAQMRTSTRFNREECVFTIQLLTGDNAGATANISIGETPVRRKLVKEVQAHGAIGPVSLVKKNLGGENDTWVFVDPDDADCDSEDTPF